MKWKLIPNWRAIAWKSHSMRALFLAFLWVVVISLVQVHTTWPIGPVIATVPLLLLHLYGALGRLIDQGIGDAE